MLSLISAQSRADQLQKRPEPFASAVDQVVRDFGNQFDLRGDVAVQMELHLTHFIPIVRKNFRNLHKTFFTLPKE
jgi:hypothetical protein